MTPKQIQMVQESFEQVVPIADAAANSYYKKLFELDPGLRSMFPADGSQQRVKLMQALTVAAHGLHQPERIIPMAEQLGRRYVTYGVKDEDYQAAGAALLWTLEQGLGDDFTPEVKDAWAAAYDLLTDAMQDAAAEIEVIQIW